MSNSSSAKKPNVYYAEADGRELPVVDITNPEFALSISPAEQRESVEAYARRQRPWRFVPRWLRRKMYQGMTRRSVLARAMSARGRFLGGLDTYLFKLGPDNLATVTTEPIDRRIAESPPVLSIRLRLQDVAELLAQFLAPALEQAGDRPLHLVNIAGGPTMDSVNALILLNRRDPRYLKGRRIVIQVLDVDSAGPAFGARALSALSTEGGPLHGLHIEFRHRVYDWSHAEELASVVDGLRSENAVWAASSEGGLFDYGSDAEVLANLERLAGASVIVGSVTRADRLMQEMQRDSPEKLVMRGHAAFGTLAARAGWRVARVVERVLSDQVALVRDAQPG
jgi:hypothetical protein